jgi:UPF0755 protein
MNIWRAIRLSMMAVILLAILVSGYSLLRYFVPRDYAETTVTIPPHSGGKAVLAELHAQGLTPTPLMMALPMVLTGSVGQLKAGEYHFEPGLSPATIISKIVHGEIVIHKITIPEGWNIFQVRAALLAEPLLSGELPLVIAEGSVFPDTIRFTRGEARADVLARMQHAREELLATAWAARDPAVPLTDPKQALILASIVERETSVGQERPIIAGVFFNRLRLGMPLQSDPTVAYGIVVAHGGRAMERALTTADLKQDTAYNSYTRVGLPPTPICNPGRDVILATLHPATTSALYFVATGHGGHVFSATLEEHTRHVNEYRATQ